MYTLNPYSLKEDIRTLCIRERYFTCGTCSQYDRMFGMAVNPDFTVRDTAMMIFSCSREDADFYTIQNQIAEIASRNAEVTA